MRKVNEYKTIKVIHENENKNTSIILTNREGLIIKKALSDDVVTINMLKNEANILYHHN